MKGSVCNNLRNSTGMLYLDVKTVTRGTHYQKTGIFESCSAFKCLLLEAICLRLPPWLACLLPAQARQSQSWELDEHPD